VSQSYSLPRKRRARQDSADVTVVKRDEFFEMLLSFRKYVRSDEPSYRGLLDVETGRRFVIEPDELLRR
jgi:hypothetical protein